MEENIYASEPRKQLASYQPRPMVSSARPKYRNPRPVVKNKVSKDPLNFDVGAPKKQIWDQQQEVVNASKPRIYLQAEQAETLQVSYSPPTIEEYSPPSSSNQTNPMIVASPATVAVYPQIFSPIYSGKIRIDPKPIAFIRNLFVNSNGVRSKLRVTPLLLTIMVIGLFSFGIYTNLHY